MFALWLYRLLWGTLGESGAEVCERYTDTIVRKRRWSICEIVVITQGNTPRLYNALQRLPKFASVHGALTEPSTA
jgi:hypothetical protein